YLPRQLLAKSRVLLNRFCRFGTESLRISYDSKVQPHPSLVPHYRACDSPAFVVLYLEEATRQVAKKRSLFHLIVDQLYAFSFSLFTFGNDTRQTRTRDS